MDLIHAIALANHWLKILYGKALSFHFKFDGLYGVWQIH